MATRTQSQIFGLGLDKEAAYNTASTTFLRFPKLNADVTSPQAMTETDAAWIGKGTEFPTQQFKTSKDVSGRIQKYGSAEWLTWAAAYALGNVTEATGTYTITHMDPATSLQLPSFSVVEQIPEGGGMAVDNLFTGCVVDSHTINFSYGPTLRSVTADLTFRGSGKVTAPSEIEVPAVTAEHHALAPGMTFTVNGTNYVTAGLGLSGSISITNNLLADESYFIGSGLDGDGFSNRGRLWYGDRKVAFDFTVLMTKDSTEYAKNKGLTTGTASVGFIYDGTHTVTYAFPQVSFTRVENVEASGLVAVKVTCDPMTATPVTVTAKCGIEGIGQLAD